MAIVSRLGQWRCTARAVSYSVHVSRPSTEFAHVRRTSIVDGLACDRRERDRLGASAPRSKLALLSTKEANGIE